LGFAGLYETYCDATRGEIDTAIIVTTAANGLLGGLHDRMPAILEPEDYAAWLDVDGVEAEEAARLLRPAPDSKLEIVEVGPAVNRAANDDESLHNAVGDPIRSAAGAG
jgi:putative SOS response-associated peptidase YedK